MEIPKFLQDTGDLLASSVGIDTEAVKEGFERVRDIATDPIGTAEDWAEEWSEFIDDPKEYLLGSQETENSTLPDSLPEVEVEKLLTDVDERDISDALRTLSALEEDARNADVVGAAEQFITTINSASDEDMAEQSILAFCEMVKQLTPATQDEIRQIVGERVFDSLMRAYTFNPDEMIAQYLTNLIAGGAQANDPGTLLVSLAYSRLSDSERQAFLAGLVATAAGLSLAKDQGSLVAGAFARFFDMPGAIGPCWVQMIGGNPYTCVTLPVKGGKSTVLAFANSRVPGLDARIFTVHEGQLMRKVSGLGGKGKAGLVLKGLGNLLVGEQRADAIQAAYDRDVYTNLLANLTRQYGEALARRLLDTAVRSASEALRSGDGDANQPTPGEEEPVLEDESEVEDSPSSSQPAQFPGSSDGTSIRVGAIPKLQDVFADNPRRGRAYFAEENQGTTAFQRGQARRATRVEGYTTLKHT